MSSPIRKIDIIERRRKTHCTTRLLKDRISIILFSIFIVVDFVFRLSVWSWKNAKANTFNARITFIHYSIVSLSITTPISRRLSVRCIIHSTSPVPPCNRALNSMFDAKKTHIRFWSVTGKRDDVSPKIDRRIKVKLAICREKNSKTNCDQFSANMRYNEAVMTKNKRWKTERERERDV